MTDIDSRLTSVLADRYTIERELGAGGMASVYLAHDLKHDRKVAVKVLRPELSAVLGGERFLNEIRVTANLQHPHILPLFDSGAEGGVTASGAVDEGNGDMPYRFLYYVMPYIDGQSLEDQIDREKQLGVEQAVEIARAVASALDYAHRHGVVHRDIKPANIMMHEDQPLVMDFGIAIAVSAAGGARITETGLSLGTPHYMSPEQATGDRDVDGRSDIYSLGCVLYEMLAGDPPHTGSTVQAVISKVVTEVPPPVSRARSAVPPHVAAAVAKSLAKIPADRFVSAADFAEALGNPAFGAATAPVERWMDSAAPVKRPKALLRFLWPVVAALAVVVAVALAFRPAPPKPLIKLGLVLESRTQLANGLGPVMAIAPDGSRIVYRGVGSEGGQLFLRDMSQLDAVPIPGTAGGTSPFFSPDGEKVGFVVGQRAAIKVVSLRGGPPLTVTDNGSLGATWGSDGYIYYSVLGSFEISRVSADGGAPEVVGSFAKIRSNDVALLWLDALPNSRGLIISLPTDGKRMVGIYDTGEGRFYPVVEGVRGRYMATGDLAYVTDNGTLLAAPLDMEKHELSGPSSSLIEGIVVSAFGSAQFAVSRTGTLVYQSTSGTDRGIVSVDRRGAEQPYTFGSEELSTPAVSPDGSSVAATVQGDVWVYRLRDGARTRLTSTGRALYPGWTPDGRHVAFQLVKDQEKDIYWRRADGTGAVERVFARPGSQEEVDFTHDGRWIVFREGDRGLSENSDILYIRADGGGEAKTIVASPFNERSPRLSPDGRWLAYISDESGRDEVYVVPFPAGDERWQVSNAGGAEPQWAHSGNEIFYRTGGNLVAVRVASEGAFSIGERRVLFSTAPYDGQPNHPAYDVLPDDQAFVFQRIAGRGNDLVVVLNWFEELKNRVGT